MPIDRPDDLEFPVAETPGKAQVEIEVFPFYCTENRFQILAPAPAYIYREALIAPP